MFLQTVQRVSVTDALDSPRQDVWLTLAYGETVTTLLIYCIYYNKLFIMWNIGSLAFLELTLKLTLKNIMEKFSKTRI